MSEIKTFMEEQAQILEREIGRCRRFLNIAPSGTLTVRKRDCGYYLYRLYTNRFGEQKDEVLSESDRKTAERIQTRIVTEVRIKLMEAALKRIRKFLKNYKCCDWETAKHKVKPMYRNPLTYQGFLQQGETDISETEGYSNRFHPEELIHKNSVGEFFRSKGEVQVSELLLNRKIRYTYEPQLFLPDRVIYPDFKVVLPGTETPKYIEYCGMMEDDKYLNRTMHKLRSYLLGGYKPGRDILFFFEDGDNGMDVQIMKRDLETFLNLSP